MAACTCVAGPNAPGQPRLHLRTCSRSCHHERLASSLSTRATRADPSSDTRRYPLASRYPPATAHVHVHVYIHVHVYVYVYCWSTSLRVCVHVRIYACMMYQCMHHLLRSSRDPLVSLRPPEEKERWSMHVHVHVYAYVHVYVHVCMRASWPRMRMCCPFVQTCPFWCSSCVRSLRALAREACAASLCACAQARVVCWF